MGFSFLGCVCGSKIVPQRYILVAILALAIIVAYGQRVNISMVIAEMVDPESSNGSQCNRSVTSEKKTGSATWTQQMQGILLAGFFVGYLVMQFPGGYLGDRFGGRYVLTTSLLISSVCTLLFSLFVDYASFPVVVACRILIGLSQASIFPNVTTLMSRWVPPSERAFMGGISFAAGALGIILGKLVSGLVYIVAGSDWRYVFYVWGAIGLVWYVFAMLFVFSDPNSHPFVSDKEKQKLEEEIIPKEKEVQLNLLKMFADPAVWALLMGHFGHDYLIFFLATSMAKYFADVLGLEMKANMWAASIPYIFMWLSSVTGGIYADWHVKKGHSVAFIRKAYTTLASVVPSICYVLMPYMGCDEVAVVALMCVSLLAMGPFFSGLKVNIMDVSYNFSGFLMAIVNGFGALSGVINPPVIGYFATENTFPQWKAIMWLIFGIATVTNIIYIIWGTGERSDWDLKKEDQEKRRAEKAAAAEEKKRKKEERKANRANK